MLVCMDEPITQETWKQIGKALRPVLARLVAQSNEGVLAESGGCPASTTSARCVAAGSDGYAVRCGREETEIASASPARAAEGAQPHHDRAPSAIWGAR